MPLATAAPCRNHPDREAIGICVSCRTRVCSECSTKVDGINHCVRCLAAIAPRASEAQGAKEGPGERRGLSAAAAVGYFATLTVLLWGMLEVLLPGRG